VQEPVRMDSGETEKTGHQEEHRKTEKRRGKGETSETIAQ
jgi:hypothetical protein